MRKVFMMVALLLLTVSGFAQKPTKEIHQVTFHGLDFSAINVIGAIETSDQFIEAFDRIAVLLVNETEKYDVAKYLKVDIISTDLETSRAQIDKLKGEKFIDNKRPVEIESIIKNYQGQGKGLVIVAKEFNKSKKTASFVYVIFDMADGRIISENEVSGEAGGFGLRNYWAGGLYYSLKNYQKATKQK